MKKETLLDLISELVANKNETLSTSSQPLPFQVGEKYFIRTVTYFSTGKVKEIVGNFLVLEDSAWIPDTGRFREAIMSGVLSEVEPVEEMIINCSSIVDAFPWKHKLPREQK